MDGNYQSVKSRVVVTGGCGFIGSNLVEKLHNLGFDVTVVDDNRQGKHFWESSSITYINEDVATCNLTEKMSRPIGIFHFANITRATSYPEDPQEIINSNIQTTTAVCEWARHWDTFLFFATDTEQKFNDNPNSYLWSKIASEEIIDLYKKMYGLHQVNMILYNVYGEREPEHGSLSNVIKKFKTNYLNQLPITVYGSGNKKRDFTHVDDVVQGMLQLLLAKELPDEVHIGKGSPKSVMALARAFDTTIVHKFDVPSEPDIIECENPYIECPTDVIQYINSWLKENPIDN